MFYKIDELSKPTDCIPSSDFVGIIPANLATNFDIINYYIPKIPTLFMDYHFSKLESYNDFLYGFINIPEILISQNSLISFILTDKYLLFIDKDNFVKHFFPKMVKTQQQNISSTGSCLYYFLDYIMSKDLEKINSLQQNLVQLELNVLSEKKMDQIKEITSYRSKTLRLHHYYIQIEGICNDIVNNTSDIISSETKDLFNILIKKISLYGHESEQIWEYTSQIREIYQQQLDVHQNIIMKFLTIVTTLFMPLTLIVGWYGMNFDYMPELRYKYRYPIVFVLSCILIAIMCIVFKKKKWW